MISKDDTLVNIIGSEVKVVEIDENSIYPVRLEEGECCTIDGRVLSRCSVPSYYAKGAKITVEDKYGSRVYRV